MAWTAEFGIIPVFVARDDTYTVQAEILLASEEEAKRAGAIFAESLGGAVAFYRMADREAGLLAEGEIIGRYGVMDEARRALTEDEVIEQPIAA